MKSFRYLVLLFMLFAGILYAEKTNLPVNKALSKKYLAGTILDTNTQKPIEYANIVVFKGKESNIVSGTVSDQQGNFLIENLPYGTYSLKISFMGYKNRIINKVDYSAQDSKLDIGNIFLSQKALKLNDVQVTGQKALIENQIDKQVVNVEQSAASNGTVIDVLRNTPSVAVDNDNNVSVRGKQGVNILVDGKPMLSDAKVLEQMPASMVEKIEVVTAPSVKYDPEGNSGIINIILKKNNQPNYNGRVSGSGSTRDKYSGTANMNYKEGDWNVFADFSKYQGKGKGNGETTRLSYDSIGALSQILNNYMYNDYTYNNNNIKIGLDYNINDFNSITVYSSLNLNYVDYTATGKAITKSNLGTMLSNNPFVNKGNKDGNEQKYSAFYKHKFDDKGHEITADAYYSYAYSDDNVDQNITYSYLPLRPNIQKTKTISNNYYSTFKTDYTNPAFLNGKLEAGYSYVYRDKESDYRFQENVDSLTDLQDIRKLSNIFDYKENIHSVYTTYSYQYKTLSFQAGLRFEQVYTDGKLKPMDEHSEKKEFRKNYSRIYPSLHISDAIAEGHSVKLSYNRRVSRPNLYMLNPFRVVNNYSINEGNPNLEPVFTHNFELGYNFNYKATYATMTTFYNYSDGNQTRVNKLVNDSVTYSSYANLANTKSWGLSAGGGSPLSSWLSVNLFFNLSRNEVTGKFQYKDTKIEDLGNIYTTWNMNAFAVVKLWWDLEANFSTYYNPSYKSKTTKTPEFMFTYASLKRTFMDRKLVFTLGISDLFNTMKFDNYSYSSNSSSRNYFKPSTSREISFSITYNLNNFKPIQTRNLDDGRDKQQDNNGGGQGGL